MIQRLLFILLQSHNYSKPKSGGEAILIGLLTGALIYGIAAAYRAIRKASQKEKDAKKN
jgi:hypothetical protein